MRGFFVLCLGVLSACQAQAVEWMDFSQTPLIEVSVVRLDHSIATFELPLHTPLEVLWDHLVCETCDLGGFNPRQKLKTGDVFHQVLWVDQRISINSASRDALQTLVGIGPALADRIVVHRETYGSFQHLEALMEVKGIKHTLFERIRPYIRL
jgi:competence ComEA-like helix-hairpin-helix protein